MSFLLSIHRFQNVSMTGEFNYGPPGFHSISSHWGLILLGINGRFVNHFGYIVERSTDGINFSEVGRTVVTPVYDYSLQYFDYDVLSDGTQYYYRVRSYDAYRISEVSEVCPPGSPNIFDTTEPQDLVVSVISSTSLKLDWTEPSPDDEILIERSTDGINFTQIGTVNFYETTFTDTGLTTGTQYYYRIRGHNIHSNYDATPIEYWTDYSTIENNTTS